MTRNIILGVLVVVALGLALALLRVQRDYAPEPGRPSPAADAIAIGELRPGGASMPLPTAPPGYREDAASVSAGQSLYENFNCSGCHQQGGGGIGPALMDDEWIYGSTPLEIFHSISEGRPNGMPAFRGKIPETQLWELVGYVRALGGLVPSVRLPARTDHLQSTPPMSLQDRQAPRSGDGTQTP